MSPAIDLRSDTVTKPDPEMRRSMAAAEVGDDVFREDPTVRRLEELGAAAVGFEAALFLPSGTMANQVALHLLGRPGGEVIAEVASHVLLYEMGALAALSGLMPRPVAGVEGRLAPAAVAAVINPEVDYRSRSVALVVENTHNMAGGVVTPVAEVAALLTLARRHHLGCHLDGARLFNAAVAIGAAPTQLAAGFDTVMFSLSKGLGAPVGSLLCARRELVEEARRVRKMLGGGMRQAGILAAAGVLALERGFDHLAQDHDNARLLADELAGMPGIELDPERVETNIVIFRLTRPPESEDPPAPRLLARMAEAGVLAVPVGPDRVRLVTHRDVDRTQVVAAIARIARCL
jgi:threonine aldolase